MKIAFCTTCKNRTQHLRQTLPRNMRDNPNALFVVLDYNSGDDLLEYLLTGHRDSIIAQKLVVYSNRDEPVFRMAHAKNQAHRCAILEGADILVNLDADNLTGPGFEDFIADKFASRRDIFLWANMVKGEMPRGISGRIVVTKQAFLKIGGYDENFEGWGSDDKNLNLRLKALDYEGVEIDPAYLQGVPHNDKIRFKEYPHLATKDDSYFEVNKSQISSAIVNPSFGCGTVYKQFYGSPRGAVVLSPLPTRVFGVGLHKTATTSLHHAFKILGFDSWHWSSAHTAKAIWREMNESGRSPTLEQFYALCDLPIPLLVEKLDLAYPNSKFILTVRDAGAWLNSVRKHWNPESNRFRREWDTDPFTHRIHTVLYGGQDFDEAVFAARYEAHNAYVCDYFKNRVDDLLIVDAGCSGWPALCDFLGEPIPDVPYPRIVP